MVNTSSTSSMTGAVFRETGAFGVLRFVNLLMALPIGFLRAKAPAPAIAIPAKPLAAEGS